MTRRVRHQEGRLDVLRWALVAWIVLAGTVLVIYGLIRVAHLMLPDGDGSNYDRCIAVGGTYTQSDGGRAFTCTPGGS